MTNHYSRLNIHKLGRVHHRLPRLCLTAALAFVSAGSYTANGQDSAATGRLGQETDNYSNDSASQVRYEIRFPQELLDKVLRHSGYARDSAGENGTIISDARITLRNQKLGKTSVAGEIHIVADDTIEFVAKEQLGFSPESDGTSIKMGKVGDRDDDNSALIVHTGRWIDFFGIKICPGQVFEIPGEVQCI